MKLEKCDITVVLCCYNSTARLQPTLEHLVKQELKPEINCEIVIVDNNSKDNTSELAANIWKGFNTKMSLTVVREPVPGLSYARKTGVDAAKGEIIVFCDDDNWLDATYIQIAFDFMKSHSEVGVLGGKGIAVSSIEFPDWFTTYQGDYAVGVQGIESGVINNRGYVWGSGMVVRKKEILSLYTAGFSSSLTGRKGSDLQAGDDSEICKWYLIVGKSLYFSELLVFRHYIESFRLTIEYNKKLNHGFSQSHIALNQYNFIINLLKRKRMSFLKIISLFMIFLFEKNFSKIATFLEFLNNTPLTIHNQTKKILKARKLFIEKENIV